MFVYPKFTLTLLVLILPVLFAACSSMVHPRGPTPIKTDLSGPIETGKEMSLANELNESELTLAATQGNDQYFLDFKQGTDSIVHQLETTLKKILLQSNPEDDYIVTFSVQNGMFSWGSWAIHYMVTVQAEMSDDRWSQTSDVHNATHDINSAIDDLAYKVAVAFTW